VLIGRRILHTRAGTSQQMLTRTPCDEVLSEAPRWNMLTPAYRTQHTASACALEATSTCPASRWSSRCRWPCQTAGPSSRSQTRTCSHAAACQRTHRKAAASVHLLKLHAVTLMHSCVPGTSRHSRHAQAWGQNPNSYTHGRAPQNRQRHLAARKRHVVDHTKALRAPTGQPLAARGGDRIPRAGVGSRKQTAKLAHRAGD
jgi:hypothetical protein